MKKKYATQASLNKLKKIDASKDRELLKKLKALDKKLTKSHKR